MADEKIHPPYEEASAHSPSVDGGDEMRQGLRPGTSEGQGGPAHGPGPVNSAVPGAAPATGPGAISSPAVDRVLHSEVRISATMRGATDEADWRQHAAEPAQAEYRIRAGTPGIPRAQQR